MWLAAATTDVGLAEVDISVAAGGEWLTMEFNMAEGGGGDAGVIYWDYNPNAPAGQRLGGGEGFPEISADVIDLADAESLYIPDTHLRSEPESCSAPTRGVHSRG